MSDYVPSESAKVVIGVCGEQGSGKTVFLTCVFQSIWTAFPDDVIIDFERKEIGNATYFQNIEDRLIAKGPSEGTLDRSLYPARIYVRPYETDPGVERAVLSVDLLDFAGRHFRSMSDLKGLLEESDSDSDDIKALREVNSTLEEADAFIILINSTEIDPLNETPRRNPFSPSVNFMLSHCRAQRKPVALLFTQIDQTPALTDEVFRVLPRVQDFERKFTDDLAEAHDGGRPYGIVRRISCYETVPGDLAPRRQTGDGSIWKREPAQAVLDLLRAAMPDINARLVEAQRLKNEEEEKECRDNEEAALAESRRARNRWAMGIAASIAILVILGLGVFALYKRTENHQVRLLESMEDRLREGELVKISPAHESSMEQILAEHRADPLKSPEAMRAAVRDLEAALGEAGERLIQEPELAVPYREEILRFQSLVPKFDARVPEGWDRKRLPMLGARSAFLADWFGTARAERLTRARFLDEAKRGFMVQEDLVFARILAEQSTREKEAEVAGWQARIDADADVPSRLATIQNLLASTLREGDLELVGLARKALAGQLASTVLKRQENGLIREKLLTPLTPSLGELEDGEVRFEVLARQVLSCTDVEDCENRRQTVLAVLAEADASAAGWSAGTDNVLRSLFLDLPPEARPEVWNALAEALSGAYLFSSRNDAWPSDLRPLEETVRKAVEAAEDPTEFLIERLAHHPIYEDELRYLSDRLGTAAALRQVVSIYSTLLTELDQGEDFLSTEALAAAGEKVSGELADFDSAESFAELASEIKDVLALASSVNTQRSQGGLDDPSAQVQLRKLLLSARHGHCSLWRSDDAPAECADAA